MIIVQLIFGLLKVCAWVALHLLKVCAWVAPGLLKVCAWVVAVVVLGARELVLYAIKWCKRRSYAAQKAPKGAAFSQKDSNEEESAPKRSAISPAPKPTPRPVSKRQSTSGHKYEPVEKRPSVLIPVQKSRPVKANKAVTQTENKSKTHCLQCGCHHDSCVCKKDGPRSTYVITKDGSVYRKN